MKPTMLRYYNDMIAAYHLMQQVVQLISPMFPSQDNFNQVSFFCLVIVQLEMAVVLPLVIELKLLAVHCSQLGQ